MTAPIDSLDFDTLLDTSGLSCPEPVMMLHGAVRDVARGQVIKVVATDPSTVRDIPKFCQFLDHKLLQYFQQDEAYIYFIRRG
ncbi:MAG: sulfurtransferase TusA [Candidatus Reddybacter sp.]